MVEEWVILELGPRSEGEDPDVIRQSIRHSLRDAEVFIPASITQVGEDRVVQYLWEGYAFVRRTRNDSDFMRLEGTRYVQSVLTDSGQGGRQRKLATVKNADILKMQAQIRVETDQGIGVGDIVKITSGPYRNIEATVIEDVVEADKVQVYIKLRSKQSIVTLPRSVLLVVTRSPLSPIRSRLSELVAWCRSLKDISAWDDTPWLMLSGSLKHYEYLEDLRCRGSLLFAFLSLYNGALDKQLATLSSRFEVLKTLHTWINRVQMVESFTASEQVLPNRVDPLTLKLSQVQWFDGIFRKIKNFRKDLDAIGHSMAGRKNDGDENVIQNVLVDGHNLAFRCLYAPGMSDLRDSQGRPTGMVLGFLRSLGSLKKKFPEASLIVTWDGTSRRRKDKYPDYKANRTPHDKTVSEGFDAMHYIRGLLPLLGVEQRYNPLEEADDVIGSIVRTELKDQHNLIYSSDRDFLQLVTDTTQVLIPGVGARKEIFYTVAMVKELFGVPPEKVIQLRAFYGDSSDNLPGVPRVPKKVLRSLVQAHGSVAGVYKSGLTGLTRGQYEKLRSSEPQVKINLDLMALVDVDVTTVAPDLDVDGATRKLQDLEINTYLLETFFKSDSNSTDEEEVTIS